MPVEDNEPPPVNRSFMYGLGAAVAVMWTISMVASLPFFHAHYETPLAVHGLMGTVVGSVFADASLRRGAKKKDDLIDGEW